MVRSGKMKFTKDTYENVTLGIIVIAHLHGGDVSSPGFFFYGKIIAL